MSKTISKHLSASVLAPRAGNRIPRSAGFTLIEILITVAVLSLLAAVALPIYENYVVRSKVTEGLGIASSIKVQVLHKFTMMAAFPESNTEADIGSPSSYSTNYVDTVTVKESGVIEVAYAMAELGSSNKLELAPCLQNNTVTWMCRIPDSGGIASAFVPSSCRNYVSEADSCEVPTIASLGSPGSSGSSGSSGSYGSSGSSGSTGSSSGSGGTDTSIASAGDGSSGSASTSSSSSSSGSGTSGSGSSGSGSSGSGSSGSDSGGSSAAGATDSGGSSGDAGGSGSSGGGSSGSGGGSSSSGGGSGDGGGGGDSSGGGGDVGLGDNTPQDSDNDGIPDSEDAFPNDANESTDSDGDGIGDNSDAFPNDANETTDSDGDGVGDNTDAFPDDANESGDADGDGIGDNQDAFPDDPDEDTDSDGDGVGDNNDAFPNDAMEVADSDGDGVGDNSDAFPDDPNESADSDGDGVGNNADPTPNGGFMATVNVTVIDEAGNSNGSQDDYSITVTDCAQQSYTGGNNTYVCQKLLEGDVLSYDATVTIDLDDNESVVCTAKDQGVNTWTQTVSMSEDSPTASLTVVIEDRESRCGSDEVPSGDLGGDAGQAGKNAVVDSDNDGVPDDQDAFPNDAGESVDSDGDGVGDNSDPTPNGPYQVTVSISVQDEMDRNDDDYSIEVSGCTAQQYTGGDNTYTCSVSVDAASWNGSVSVRPDDREAVVCTGRDTGERPWTYSFDLNAQNSTASVALVLENKASKCDRDEAVSM